MSTKELSNSDSYIDSRDLINAIEEMKDEIDGLRDDIEITEKDLEEIENKILDAEDSDELKDLEEEKAELEEEIKVLEGQIKDIEFDLEPLESFADEFEGYCLDWKYGVSLIRESEFTDYVKEMVKDVYGFPKDFPSWIEIDWDATADNVRVDYTEGDFDGITYLAR